MSEARLAEEAVRLYRRYAVEVVEALGFCPYAERARLDGRTRELVVAEAEPSDAEVLEAVEAVASEASIEIGLVLLPRSDIEPLELGRWVERLRKAHASRHGGAPVLALEGFHPHARADTSHPDRLTPFVRRTPDPTIQLTRLSVLDRVRRGTVQGTAFFDPSSIDVAALLAAPAPRALHERIAERNLETVVRLGAEPVARIMDAITHDRDATYRAIDPTIRPRRAG